MDQQTQRRGLVRFFTGFWQGCSGPRKRLPPQEPNAVLPKQGPGPAFIRNYPTWPVFRVHPSKIFTTLTREYRIHQPLTDPFCRMSLLFRYCLWAICLLGSLGRACAQRLELKVPLAHSDAITAIAFSPDGRYALSGSADNHLRLWEVATGREVRSFTGHADKVIAAAFSPDRQYVLSATYKKAVFWEVATRKKVRTL